MSFEVYYHPRFSKDLKRLTKKYHSIKDEVSELIDELAETSETGIRVKENVYKIRVCYRTVAALNWQILM
jgi:mRNA-degrading endonuclease RelE of RelBE toxin-antitoxin system